MADTQQNVPQTPQKTTGAKIVKKVKRGFYTVLFLALIGLAGLVYWHYFFTYSEGYRAGLLQKFSKKGTIFKTYEGEMILSSVSSNRNIAIASEKFTFSVSDPVLAIQLDSLQGKEVIVQYLQKNGALPWRGESPYIVTSIKRETMP